MSLNIPSQWKQSGLDRAKVCISRLGCYVKMRFTPWQVQSEPLNHLFSLHDDDEIAKWTTRWSNEKIAELSVVSVTVSPPPQLCVNMRAEDYIKGALIAAVIAGAFSWTRSTEIPWTSQAVWYSSLILALASVSTASQQSIGLYRLGSHPEGLRKLRILLGGPNQNRPRKSQLYIWQVAVMSLNVSVLLFLIGLAILLWDLALTSSTRATDTKVWSNLDLPAPG